MNIKKYDVIIIGAGASGLMCGIEAIKRNRSVLIIDHNKRVGNKILISGGGKCNFTNYELSAKNYLSKNPHFCKSAISRFNQWEFLDLIYKYNIEFEEREFGRLFTVDGSKDIIDLLLNEGKKINFSLKTKIVNIDKTDQVFRVEVNDGEKKIYSSNSLVVATGGISYSKLGATDFGYKIAKKFNISLIDREEALVPLIVNKKYFILSGIALNAIVTLKREKKEIISFNENLLFTHKGLSGPAILQVSSYFKRGDKLIIDLLPKIDISKKLIEFKEEKIKKQVNTILSNYLPKKVINLLFESSLLEKQLYSISKNDINDIGKKIKKLEISPIKKDSYDKAEVTIGGIDTTELSSKTMGSKKIEGLFFIGEVIDIVGWLGGYNLQWAWASGWVAGQYV